MEQKFDLQKIKKLMLRKYAPFGSIISNIKYKMVDENNNIITTAATDGETIYFNEKYMSSLSESEQVFNFAHEVLHIALKHIIRSKGKNCTLWNIATDGIINQQLKKDGLAMPKGCVDIPDALSYNAEELYEKLLKDQLGQQGQQGQQEQEEKQGQQNQQGKSQSKNKQENLNDKGQQEHQHSSQGKNKHNQEQKGQQNQKDNSQSNNKQENINDKGQQGQQHSSQGEQNNKSSQNNQSQNVENNVNQVGHDNHSMWADAVKKAEEQKEQNNEQSNENNDIEKIDEREFFNKLEEDRIKRAEDIMRKINSNRYGTDGEFKEVKFGDIGETNSPVVNWKKLLVYTIEKEEEIWGRKYSGKYNNYAVRLEDVDVQDEVSETEIILDVSGSVSVDLLKNFLRQVKSIIKNSNIKVGTFSNNFNGFVEIKKKSDIDSLRLKIGGGTNYDAASRAFSKRRDITKICFTDGWDDYGNAHIEEKRNDIIWICYENKDFKPDNGKVIYVSENEINKLTKDNEQDMSF